MATCSVVDCSAPAKTRGVCNTHYQRFLRRGTYDKHKMPTLEERFWSKVDKTETCWLWTGGTNGVYGRMTIKTNGVGSTVYAHRLAWELTRGPIPDGHHIDHLCRVTTCVNPDHLEPVTPQENTQRGYSIPIRVSRARDLTHCPKGHPYSGDNVRHYNGRRICRACDRARNPRKTTPTKEK